MEINMKEVDGVFVQDMDPYAEYEYKEEKQAQSKRQTEVVVQPSNQKQARDKMNQMIENIDEMMDGMNIMLEFGNKLAERFRRF